MENQTEVDITAGPDAGIYQIFALYCKDSVFTTAQGLLEIAAWVEQHRDQLRKEAGQELTSYRVELHVSRVRRIDKPVPAVTLEATNALEAAGRALRRYGERQMKIIAVIGAENKVVFEDVVLQDDLESIIFGQSYERLRPQPPFDQQEW